MSRTTIQPTAAWISRVTALLSSGDTGPRAVARFLPPRQDPEYSEVLFRLVRTDLRSKAGAARSSAYAEYRSAFPELPVQERDDVISDSTDLTQTPLPPMMSQTQAMRIQPLEFVTAEDPPTAYPKPGDTFGDFKLVDELGRGAFGRVFLATEHKLADRLVALKMTRKATNESQRLARLQHTNIVPIHNSLSIQGWNVLQMPFFGRQTLADLLTTVKAEKAFPKVSGEVFASTQMRATTCRKQLSSTSPTASPSQTPNPDSDRVRVSPEILLQAGERQPSREMLIGLSYSDAAVWIIHRLADGLAHAHDKEILHLDLKPQNVLLSDDGQPMLLDFNLSFDRKTMDRDRVGGTWPYMSPEQICEYARRPGSTVDERSDLFALGVMFFELLTTRHPFDPVQTTDVGLTKAIANRMARAPDVRTFNPHVPASIAAVVAKLLAPLPMHRYQSADQLREDLRRHGENRPLAFARDRSIKERATKWHRRHPKASLMTCIGVLLFGLLFSAAQMMAWSRDRQRLAATDQAREFHTDLAALRLDLASIKDQESRRKAVEKAEVWLQKYRVSQPAWADEPGVRLLGEADGTAIRNGLGELAALTAHAHWLNHRDGEASEKEAELHAARAGNTLAAAAFASPVPGIVARQRAELDGVAAGDLAVGESSEELYVQAVRDIAGSKFKEAAVLLTKLTHRQPDHYAGQFALGICLEGKGQVERAAERFQVAKPLAPKDSRPSFHRANLLYHQGRFDEAEADFSDAIDREPQHPAQYLQRGMTRRCRNNIEGSIEDFTKEIEITNGHRFIALAMRAQSHRLLKNEEAAKRDDILMDTIEPRTDLEYVSRATRWLAQDPLLALADYHKALKLNPECLSALMNSAHLYAEILDQPEMALGVQRKAVKSHPGYNRVRSGHAVILARLGQRAEAHAEAEAALLLGADNFVTYQAACVFALTATDANKDHERALNLLRQALREGFRRFDLLSKDADLASIRDTEDYRRAVSAAMELVK